MGEGKSSIILFLLCNHFSTKENIFSITVLPPLMTIMKDLVKKKLGGFYNRRVFLLPFDRSIDISLKNLEILKKELDLCLKKKKVLIVTSSQRMCLQLKQREVHLQLMESLSAKNILDWDPIKQKLFDRAKFLNKQETSVESDLKILNNFLVNIGIIDERNQILKPPISTSEKGELIDILNPKKKELETLSKEAIEQVIKSLLIKSVASKEDLETKLKILTEILQFPIYNILDESDVKFFSFYCLKEIKFLF